MKILVISSCSKAHNDRAPAAELYIGPNHIDTLMEGLKKFENAISGKAVLIYLLFQPGMD